MDGGGVSVETTCYIYIHICICVCVCYIPFSSLTALGYTPGLHSLLHTILSLSLLLPSGAGSHTYFTQTTTLCHVCKLWFSGRAGGGGGGVRMEKTAAEVSLCQLYFLVLIRTGGGEERIHKISPDKIR